MLLTHVNYFITASCQSSVNESEASDSDREATCPGLLRSGMGDSANR